MSYKIFKHLNFIQSIPEKCHQTQNCKCIQRSKHYPLRNDIRNSGLEPGSPGHMATTYTTKLLTFSRQDFVAYYLESALIDFKTNSMFWISKMVTINPTERYFKIKKFKNSFYLKLLPVTTGSVVGYSFDQDTPEKLEIYHL